MSLLEKVRENMGLGADTVDTIYRSTVADALEARYRLIESIAMDPEGHVYPPAVVVHAGRALSTTHIFEAVAAGRVTPDQGARVLRVIRAGELAAHAVAGALRDVADAVVAVVTRWLYTFVDLNNDATMQEELCEMGDKSWELVSVVPLVADTSISSESSRTDASTLRAFFKRPQQ
jgi:hypothetical protein